jgi:multiple sugar transport system substrate-binding protein
MKYLFTILLGLLIVASVLTSMTAPEATYDVPVIYWVTDANPARYQQVNAFHEWLVENGFTREDDPTRPAVVLKVDTANRAASKKLIQGVSGVAGDIMDVGSNGGDLAYFAEVGMITDLTKRATSITSPATSKPLSFDPTQTWQAIRPEITVLQTDGERHQYMFPCNVAAQMYWVNKATFKKYDIEPPSGRWSFEEFERIGKQFVERANRGKDFRDVFFADKIPYYLAHRSVGVSMFNETLTRCPLDDPRYVRVMKLLHKWTYEDRILPSQSDRLSFASQSGYGGATLQLFNRGNYAMFMMGRYALIQLRKFGQLELGVVEPPNGGFPNTICSSRGAVIYKASKHRDLAMLFEAFLASEAYNMQIVRDADALPPNPKYTRTDEFLRPSRFPNEWGTHEAFAKAMETIAIGTSHSPFVLTKTAYRLRLEAYGAFIMNVISPEEAARRSEETINIEIARTLAEQPALRASYERLLERQEQIDQLVMQWKQVDALRQAGDEQAADELASQTKKIPLSWIENPYHVKYYTHLGWVNPAE